ncbi:MAG: hypothetical protein ACOX1Y_02505 [Zhaonellaceae bacterium]|jgi:hypothetical protein
MMVSKFKPDPTILLSEGLMKVQQILINGWKNSKPSCSKRQIIEKVKRAVDISRD